MTSQKGHIQKRHVLKHVSGQIIATSHDLDILIWLDDMITSTFSDFGLLKIDTFFWSESIMVKRSSGDSTILRQIPGP